MTLFILCTQTDSLDLKGIAAIVALILSTISLFVTATYYRKNIKLTIQNTIYKAICEKVKDCNTLWEIEPQNEKETQNSPHFKIVSELIMTMELIDNSLTLYQKNYESIQKEYSVDFYKLFYQQLRTDLRGWLKRTPDIAKEISDTTYTSQIDRLTKHFKPYY